MPINDLPIHVPAFRPSLRVDCVPGEGAYFFSEAGQLVLTGSITEEVSRLIDGRRSSNDIATSLAGRIRDHDVYCALEMLSQNQLIFDAAASGIRDDLNVWNYVGADLPRVEEHLRTVPVQLITTQDIDQTPMLDALRCFGLKVCDGDGFTVVLTGDYLDPRLPEINCDAMKTGRPWMIAKLTGALQMFGPVFRPGITACWECLAQRIRAHRALEHHVDRCGRSVSLARAASGSPLDSVAVRLAALHAARFVALGENAQLEGRVIRFEPMTLSTSTHIVSRRPQCTACGRQSGRAKTFAPPVLDNRVTNADADNSHRGNSAQQTFSLYEHHVSPITGLVRALSPMRTASDDIIRLYVASHNFVLDGSSTWALRQSIETNSCGKGATEAEARTGALLEALERYSGVFQGDEPRVSASYRALGSEAIHPNDCMLYSERQYARRQQWNQLGSTFSLVPNPLDETAEIEWTPVWSFGSRTFRYLPTSYLYYGYPQDHSTASSWADSNGNAAGNSLEEAILHGFLELVERDAVALWWYNRLSLPALDLASFREPYIDRTLEFYRRSGREFWALDLTSDFEIPVAAAVSRRVDGPLEEITLGFGASLDARVALKRAVAEMNQFLPAVSGPLDANGKRQYAYPDASAIRWWQSASVADQPYLLPDSVAKRRTASDFQTPDTDDLLVDVMHCVLKAQQLGLDTLLLDQTRPDVGVPVAKVLIPGIRHFWARLGPGRLYDRPVTMGRLRSPLREEDLNPIPMFL